MKRLLAALTLAALTATGAAAQNLWTPEFGVQGGFARVKPAGTGASDHQDLFSIPGLSLSSALPSPATLFFIVPASARLAIEPSFAAAAITDATGGELDLVSLGARADYAITPHLYAAAGAGLNYSSGLADNEAQFGLQAALGYRTALTGTLNGRIEAQWSTWGKTDNIDPYNVYALALGVSTRLGARPGAPARRATRPGLWRPVIGVAGGYAKTHFVGESDLAAFTAPGITSLLASAGASVPPTLFAIVPLGGRWALEPGFDLVRAQSGGTTTTAGQLQARLDYAFDAHWYGAAGVQLLYVRRTGQDAATNFAGNVAGGYRFPLVGELGGRVELNYYMTRASDDFTAVVANGASNTFGV
ncbi:MAG TPA: hypothetical protein VNI61_06440, partial [Gemmatimonadales bacterium]|nr:hypothetical protein [Gemmatimonadales bacterium]